MERYEKLCRQLRKKINPVLKRVRNAKLHNSIKLHKTERYKNYQKTYTKHNRIKITIRKYNITPSKYGTMLAQQNNGCAICKKIPTGKIKNLAIDHCHETNKIRGLLCNRCNTILGMAKDNVAILKAAIKYLEKNSNGERHKIIN